MRVDIITKEYPPEVYGGAGVHVTELVKALRESIDVQVRAFGAERDEPGTKAYGVLSIFVQLHADVRRLLALPPGAFRPAPRVHSAVLRLAFRPPAVAVADEPLFEGMVRSMFTQRRKTLGNALRPFATGRGGDPGAALRAAGIDPTRRPETLQLDELARLAEFFTSA